MNGLSEPAMVLTLVLIAGTCLAMLNILTSFVRRETAVHDLRVRAKKLKAEYEAQLAEADNYDDMVEILDDEPDAPPADLIASPPPTPPQAQAEPRRAA